MKSVTVHYHSLLSPHLFIVPWGKYLPYHYWPHCCAWPLPPHYSSLPIVSIHCWPTSVCRLISPWPHSITLQWLSIFLCSRFVYTSPIYVAHTPHTFVHFAFAFTFDWWNGGGRFTSLRFCISHTFALFVTFIICDSSHTSRPRRHSFVYVYVVTPAFTVVVNPLCVVTFPSYHIPLVPLLIPSPLHTRIRSNMDGLRSHFCCSHLITTGLTFIIPSFTRYAFYFPVVCYHVLHVRWFICSSLLLLFRYITICCDLSFTFYLFYAVCPSLRLHSLLSLLFITSPLPFYIWFIPIYLFVVLLMLFPICPPHCPIYLPFIILTVIGGVSRHSVVGGGRLIRHGSLEVVLGDGDPPCWWIWPLLWPCCYIPLLLCVAPLPTQPPLHFPNHIVQYNPHYRPFVPITHLHSSDGWMVVVVALRCVVAISVSAGWWILLFGNLHLFTFVVVVVDHTWRKILSFYITRSLPRWRTSHTFLPFTAFILHSLFIICYTPSHYLYHVVIYIVVVTFPLYLSSVRFDTLVIYLLFPSCCYVRWFAFSFSFTAGAPLTFGICLDFVVVVILLLRCVVTFTAVCAPNPIPHNHCYWPSLSLGLRQDDSDKNTRWVTGYSHWHQHWAIGGWALNSFVYLLLPHYRHLHLFIYSIQVEMGSHLLFVDCLLMQHSLLCCAVTCALSLHCIVAWPPPHCPLLTIAQLTPFNYCIVSIIDDDDDGVMVWVVEQNQWPGGGETTWPLLSPFPVGIVISPLPWPHIVHCALLMMPLLSPQPPHIFVVVPPLITFPLPSPIYGEWAFPQWWWWQWSGVGTVFVTGDGVLVGLRRWKFSWEVMKKWKWGSQWQWYLTVVPVTIYILHLTIPLFPLTPPPPCLPSDPSFTPFDSEDRTGQGWLDVTLLHSPRCFSHRLRSSFPLSSLPYSFLPYVPVTFWFVACCCWFTYTLHFTVHLSFLICSFVILRCWFDCHPLSLTSTSRCIVICCCCCCRFPSLPRLRFTHHHLCTALRFAFYITTTPAHHHRHLHTHTSAHHLSHLYRCRAGSCLRSLPCCAHTRARARTLRSPPLAHLRLIAAFCRAHARTHACRAPYGSFTGSFRRCAVLSPAARTPRARSARARARLPHAAPSSLPHALPSAISPAAAPPRLLLRARAHLVRAHQRAHLLLLLRIRACYALPLRILPARAHCRHAPLYYLFAAAFGLFWFFLSARARAAAAPAGSLCLVPARARALPRALRAARARHCCCAHIYWIAQRALWDQVRRARRARSFCCTF